MLRSQEADVYPRRYPAKADEIDGSLGDGSWFHRTYGYYAHGVAPETAKAPAGWQERLIPVEIPPRARSQLRAIALCLDLVLAKCVAGRERDWDFAGEALRHDLVDWQVLLSRIDDLPVSEDRQLEVRRTLEGIHGQLRARGKRNHG